MIVLDAAIVVELLTGGPLSGSLRQDLARRADSFIVPQLLDAEVVSAIRGLVAGQRIAHRSGQLLKTHADLPAERFAHTPRLQRAWELRHYFAAYDAVYIAMAEATNAVRYKSDEKLSRGHRAR